MNVLIVVESPAKAKTVENCLGGENTQNEKYTVIATQGAVRELKPKEGNVDSTNDFAINYQHVEKNRKHVDAIITAIKNADAIYLAHNPNRKGEIESWHLLEAIHASPDYAQDLFENKIIKRVTFHELSKDAIESALTTPRDIYQNTVHAQQADDALSYLFNTKLSALLGKKIRRGFSIDRFQSPALRLIVRKEREIEGFQEQEYWTVEAELSAKKQIFTAKLTHYQTTELSKLSIDHVDITDAIETTLSILTKGKLTVSKIEETQRTQKPASPFITATLQQEASRKFNFTALRTMRVAQQLFDGIDLSDAIENHEGHTSLISFIYTNSDHLSKKISNELRQVIDTKYGKKFLPETLDDIPAKDKPREQAREKNSAIYPIYAHIIPNKVRPKLTADQFKLYDLIWKRSIASQMVQATINTKKIHFDAVQGAFCTSSLAVAAPCFMKVYSQDISNEENASDVDRLLPALKEGDKVNLKKISPQQHFTKPPARFTEASLLNLLETKGIGQPTTYATIIATLLNREYIELEQKHFYPTDIGRVINKFLNQHFSEYVSEHFSNKIENELRAIENGKNNYLTMMQDFWKPFDYLISDKTTNVDRKDITQEIINETCPKCNEPLSIRLGRRGRFIGCTTYPKCDYTRNLVDDENEEKPETIDGKTCPECQSELILKQGRYGKFIGCSAYPKCKHMEPLDSPEDSGISCPQCKKGTILKRKARTGKTFYSCSTYPKCKYAIWNPPLAESCPDCNWPILTIKTTKTSGAVKTCPQKACHFSQAINN